MPGAVGEHGHRAHPNYLLLAVAFAVSRLLLLPHPQPTSDVDIYARYVQEAAAAARHGESFYEYHARAVEQRAAEAREKGTLTAPLDEYKDVEYPPLALAVLRLPLLWMREAPGAELTPAFEAAYRDAYRLGLAFVDIGLFVLLVVLVWRLYGTEDGREQTQRLLMYLAATVLLWHLLYDRLDLILAALVLLALAALVGRGHYGWSFALLAVAVNFKVVPLVLAPVWVVGSLSAGRLAGNGLRALAALAGRSAVLVGLCAAIFLPFYLAAGPRSLGFLAYHRGRPLEINSLAASLLLAPRLWGQAIPIEYTYASLNVRAPLTPTLTRLTPWLGASALLAATALLLAHFRRRAVRAAGEPPSDATLAQRYPLDVVAFVLLFWMVFLVVNKVFSTQYLLGLAPLVALLPFGRGYRRLFGWSFLVICLLSTVLVPFLFVSDLLDQATTVPRTFKDPSARIVVVLLARNLLFVALTASLAYRLGRGEPRAGAQ
jgi:hypothetical protein